MFETKLRLFICEVNCNPVFIYIVPRPRPRVSSPVTDAGRSFESDWTVSHPGPRSRV